MGITKASADTRLLMENCAMPAHGSEIADAFGKWADLLEIENANPWTSHSRDELVSFELTSPGSGPWYSDITRVRLAVLAISEGSESQQGGACHCSESHLNDTHFYLNDRLQPRKSAAKETKDCFGMPPALSRSWSLTMAGYFRFQ